MSQLPEFHLARTRQWMPMRARAHFLLLMTLVPKCLMTNCDRLVRHLDLQRRTRVTKFVMTVSLLLATKMSQLPEFHPEMAHLRMVMRARAQFLLLMTLVSKYLMTICDRLVVNRATWIQPGAMT
eukprot:Polyplicarium_translucidae@DN3205_c0_g1_i2.p3